MQTLTIRVDESYIEQIITFLQKIPQSKREIFQHTKIDISPKNIVEDTFLNILENGPTISNLEANEWEDNITEGFKYWNIKEF